MRQKFGRVNYYITKVLRKIEKDGDRLILVPIIIYALFFSAYTCYMHYVFKTYAWDLGIVTQSLWTTLNSGKVLYSTLEVPYGNPSGNFLGVHFSPILFLVLPVYAVFQSPQTLLVFQSFILAVAALPLYWIARDKLGSKLYGFAFAFVYLLNPALHGVNTFDFHLEIFTPVFVLFSFYYLEKGKWFRALPFIILEFMTLEFAPFIVFALGLYFFLKKAIEGFDTRQRSLNRIKKLVIPIIIMVASVICLFLALGLITAINPAKAGGPYGTWSYWGENVSESVTNMLRHPFDVITRLLTPYEKPYFIIFLFSTVLFLPLLAPVELILPLPWLLAALLTDYQPYYQPYYQYSALVLGQIFIAAVYGFRRLFSPERQSNNKNETSKKIVATMVLLNVLLFVTISPVGIPAFTTRSIRPYAMRSQLEFNHVNELYKVLNLIPSNASVATIYDIFPHVCQRLNAYFLKSPLDYDVDYVLVDLKSPTYTMGIYGPTPDKITVELMEKNEYGILASSDGILLLKRGYTDSLKYYSPQVDTFDYDELIPSSGKIVWDYSSASGKVIMSDPENSVGMVWFGPYKYFAPGNYSVIFELRTANETCKLLLDIAAQQGTFSIANRIVDGTEFRQMNTWQEFPVNFRIDMPTKLEFRGIGISNNTEVSVDYVRVEQIGP